ncbi:MAG TPA: hypothetical protein PKE69_19620 [Pyrinomonadaceae bacterium]|nr:hypothetical protein [Pyrinomonadaceae bacterium]
MLKKIYTFIFIVLCLAFTSTSILAQNQQDIQKVVSRVQDAVTRTAIVENGILQSVRLPIPDQGEKLFTFEWANDGRSYTMTSETEEEIQVFFNEKYEVQSMILPNGEIVTFTWSIVDGANVVTDAVIGNGTNAVSIFEMASALPGPNTQYGGDCASATRAARDAIIAAAITCGVSPGRGCWAAVGFASYMVWRMRQACAE